jgi:2-polyprenyl-3-methyl-5-hydroxy-6-metoxy-1,4-benzoquinol methylase
VGRGKEGPVTTGSSDFDAKARTWDEDEAKRRRAERVAAAIAARFPLAGRAVLEYGAGTGLLGLALRPLVADVTLADVSREMLAVADDKIAAGGFRNARTLLLDLSVGPAPDRRYDLVCSLMALHHVPDIDGILRAFHGVLSPRGALCIADLDREDGSYHGAGFTGHAGFDRADLGGRIARAGFADVRFETVFEMTKATGTGQRVFPVFLATAAAAAPGR